MNSDLDEHEYALGLTASSCPNCRAAVASPLEDIPFQELIKFEEEPYQDDSGSDMSIDELDTAESTDTEEDRVGPTVRFVILSDEHPTPG